MEAPVLAKRLLPGVVGKNVDEKSLPRLTLESNLSIKL